jgi:hypothetical protein
LVFPNCITCLLGKYAQLEMQEIPTDVNTCILNCKKSSADNPCSVCLLHINLNSEGTCSSMMTAWQTRCLLLDNLHSGLYGLPQRAVSHIFGFQVLILDFILWLGHLFHMDTFFYLSLNSIAVINGYMELY